ncbi:MAG TPA: M20/M25/M40 family metallo-hydrolase [Longimicrobiales bacterium]|nr:M20/M25/M40 family metallo-hydrolase [Longimicrobiales bacterium]
MNHRFRPTLGLALLALLPASVYAQKSAQPLKYTAKPTTAAITAADLMSRLYPFADDSMGGRAVGTPFNLKGTDYIANEVKKFGLLPGGDNGTYFQDIGVFTRALDRSSTITVDGKTFAAGTDFLANLPTALRTQNSYDVVFGGSAVDTTNVLSPDAVRGKLLLMTPLTRNIPQSEVQTLINSEGYKRYLATFRAAGAVATIAPAAFNANQQRNAFEPTGFGPLRVRLLGETESGPTFTVQGPLAEALLGVPVANATKGQTGKTATVNLQYKDNVLPGRNVIAILRGSDPKLRGSYVAIGAHNDHVPFRQTAVDHDSLRAFNTVARPGGVEDAPKTPTAEEWTRINAMKDSLRALHGGVRLDSINNGADDDGSGSMGVLEIAEAFAKAKVKPKRSIIFVWHTGEERGMYGSNYFTDHPTVPRDSIIAQLNVDMIGRGSVGDPVPWSGDSYVQLIGSRRLSKELGDLVETVNTATKAGFKFDYGFDANGDPHNYYCRSDHWAYARYGIPITFFTTGGHRDYHMITDEPQYIDYAKYAKVSQLIHDIGERVANLDHRPVVDGKKGDPYATCQQ